MRRELVAVVGLLFTTSCNLFGGVSEIPAAVEMGTADTHGTDTAGANSDIADAGADMRLSDDLGPMDVLDTRGEDAAPDLDVSDLTDADDAGIDTAPSCDDLTRNGDESDIDCGGGCPPCDLGEACVTHSDCDTAVCDAEDLECVRAASCLALHEAQPQIPTGTYTISTADGELDVFCEMDRMNGGWTRIANVDPGANQTCPGNWSYEATSMSCTRPDSGSGSQSSVTFGAPIPYSEVIGYVLGYQKRSPDSFRGAAASVDDIYVDGISITLESVPTTHIWTYANAWSDTDPAENSLCPCQGDTNHQPQTFVGTHYYCESGAPDSPLDDGNIWYTSDPLWDGGTLPSDCDTPDDPSWFHRDVDTTDLSLEVRIMADQSTTNENTGVSRMELFVR